MTTVTYESSPATPAIPASLIPIFFPNGTDNMTIRVRGRAVTWLFCAAVALVEGYDLQSAGLAAPRMAPVFRLSSSDLAWVFSTNTVGLLFGALIGGRLSDRIGRKALLIAALLSFGAFSIGTALVSTFDALLMMRLLTGIGLGGAFPALISLVAETGRRDTQAGRVTMVTAAMPLGGALAGVLMLLADSEDWTLLFHIGGVVPILLAIIGARVLPTASPDGPLKPASTAAIVSILFGERRAAATLALWGASFATLSILYLLLNWLPMLMINRGLDRTQAMGAAFAFSASGALGAFLLGGAGRRGAWRLLLGTTYAGIGSGLFALSVIIDTGYLITAAAVVGFFVIGAQFLLYGMSASLYPEPMRGSGVGAAVAAGRLGAIAGPLLAGVVLTSGADGAQVLMVLLPIVAIAFVAAVSVPRGAKTLHLQRKAPIKKAA